MRVPFKRIAHCRALFGALAAGLALVACGGGSSSHDLEEVPTSIRTPEGAVLRADARAWLRTDSITQPGQCSVWFNVKATVSSAPQTFPANVRIVSAQAWKSQRELTTVGFSDPQAPALEGQAAESTDSTCVTFAVSPGDMVTVVVDVQIADQPVQRIRTESTDVRSPG